MVSKNNKNKTVFATLALILLSISVTSSIAISAPQYARAQGVLEGLEREQSGESVLGDQPADIGGPTPLNDTTTAEGAGNATNATVSGAAGNATNATVSGAAGNATNATVSGAAGNATNATVSGAAGNATNATTGDEGTAAGSQSGGPLGLYGD